MNYIDKIKAARRRALALQKFSTYWRTGELFSTMTDCELERAAVDSAILSPKELMNYKKNSKGFGPNENILISENQECVYFIQDSLSKNIKIGTSKNFSKRLFHFRMSNGSPLIVLLVIPGGRDKEAKFHRDFKSSRLHGEWFCPNDEIIKTIEYIKKFSRYEKLELLL